MPNLSFRPLRPAERDAALAVINEAASWYAEFLPPEALHGPEMSVTDFEAEGQRMIWYGAFAGERLVGVMGLEHVKDVALIRHGYVSAALQRQGVGSALLQHLEDQARVERIVIGTYAANYKARAALERCGYRLSDDSEAVLREYYTIPEDRLAASVTYEKTRFKPNLNAEARGTHSSHTEK